MMKIARFLNEAKKPFPKVQAFLFGNFLFVKIDLQIRLLKALLWLWSWDEWSQHFNSWTLK